MWKEEKKRGKERIKKKEKKRKKREKEGKKEAVLALGVVKLIFIVDFWKVGDEEEFKMESNGGDIE